MGFLVHPPALSLKFNGSWLQKVNMLLYDALRPPTILGWIWEFQETLLSIFGSSESRSCRLRNKEWLTGVLKQPVNHKSWLTGFRNFVRIPSTIPTGTSRLDIWIFGYLDYGNQFVAASPIRTSVWCSPAVFVFAAKTRTWCFCIIKQWFLHFNETRLDGRGLKS